MSGGDESMGGGERSKGSVNWFDPTKGFGFVTPNNGGEGIFVHQSSIKSKGFRSLAAGESVEFVVEAVDVCGPDGVTVQGGRGGFGGGGGRGGGRYEGGGRGSGGRGGGGNCYKCGEEGDMARECSQGGGGGGYRGGGGGGSCYICGEVGHLGKDCTSGGR